MIISPFRSRVIVPRTPEMPLPALKIAWRLTPRLPDDQPPQRRLPPAQASGAVCKRICKPDAAGQPETGETEPTERDGICPVCRGHQARGRRLETAETDVVWLITQRSRVQIPPPLPSLQVRGLFRSWKRPSACAVCTELCTRPLRKAAVATGGQTYPRTPFATKTTSEFY
jgi:hypothetical protein